MVQKAPSRNVTAARKLKANWFATQTGKQWKTMVNNELHCLKERIRKDVTSSSYITVLLPWLGKVLEGQEKQSDDIIPKLKLINILSFQGPTASFAIQQGVFFISCDRFV